MTSLRVAYDITPSLVSRSGVGRYASELEAVLAAQPDIELTRQSATRGSHSDQFVRRIARGLRREISYYPIELARKARRARADIVHCPGPFPARCKQPPLVLTIHDAILWRFPELFTRVNTLHQLHLLAPAARRAQRVITSSRHSAAELAHLVGIDPARIAVTPLGVHPRFRPIPAAPDWLACRFGIVAPYVLAVGTLEPRKNLVSAIRAFERAAAEGSAAGHALVVAGGRGWRNGELDQVLASTRAEVHLVDHVEDSELIALYSAASCFVYPSLYEGFGLPVLEAMACGAPVLTSNTTSLPEVVDGAALCVDPRDVEAIADGLTSILTHPDTARDLRQRGLARAAELTWERCARATIAVYREALAECS